MRSNYFIIQSHTLIPTFVGSVTHAISADGATAMQPTKNARTRAFFIRSVSYPFAPFHLRKWLFRLNDAARGARSLFLALFSVFVRRFPLRLCDCENLPRLFAVIFRVCTRFPCPPTFATSLLFVLPVASVLFAFCFLSIRLLAPLLNIFRLLPLKAPSNLFARNTKVPSFCAQRHDNNPLCISSRRPVAWITAS